jgi:uncharacterized alkaline shock family protein YloU
MDKVVITDPALESLIVHACLSTDGVVSMWKGLKQQLPFLDREGVQPHGVAIGHNALELTLDVYIAARFGSDLRKLAAGVREAVAKEVEASTPYHVREVNVHIADVRA